MPTKDGKFPFNNPCTMPQLIRVDGLFLPAMENITITSLKLRAFSSEDCKRFKLPTHNTSSQSDTLSPNCPPPRYNFTDKSTKPTTAPRDVVCCLWKGETYIIRDTKTKLVIALTDGKLGLHSDCNQHHRYEVSWSLALRRK